MSDHYLVETKLKVRSDSGEERRELEEEWKGLR